MFLPGVEGSKDPPSNPSGLLYGLLSVVVESAVSIKVDAQTLNMMTGGYDLFLTGEEEGVVEDLLV